MTDETLRVDGDLVDVPVDPADEYDREAVQFMVEFRSFITKQFGDRCDTFGEGCPCCDLWQLYDEVSKKVIL